MSHLIPISPPHVYDFDFSLSGQVAGGRQQESLFGDMPRFAEYYVNDDQMAVPFGQILSPILADWIDIAVAVYFADRFAVRRARSVARKQYLWGRVINLRLGVRQPELWQRPEISESLRNLLAFITEDKWQIEFVARQGEPRYSEVNPQTLLFPVTAPACVALYSGGLDSFAGVAQHMNAHRDQHFVLVSGVTNSRQQAGQREQVRAIAGIMGQMPTHVTVPLRRSWREVQQPEEWSQRARGFLFLTLGSAAALAIGSDDLYMFENGIGAINLPINGTQVGTYNSRAVNPITLLRMAEFISILTGKAFTIKNPCLLHTKGEMCGQEIVSHLGPYISKTFSCDGFPVRAHQRPQCGSCTSCLLRRVSLLSANLNEHDHGYLVDVLSDRTNLSKDQQHALRAMYWQARTISQRISAADPWQSLTCEFPALARIEEAMATQGVRDRAQLRSALVRLYEQYVREWKQFQARCPVLIEPSVCAA